MTIELDITTAEAPTTSLAGCGEEAAPSTRALVRDILERVSDKWTMFVIGILAEGPQRFGALQACVPGISHRMLTRTLRALERDGMVTRTVYAQVPPRVDYELTPLGATLIEPVLAFVGWVERHQDEVEANRAAFDA